MRVNTLRLQSWWDRLQVRLKLPFVILSMKRVKDAANLFDTMNAEVDRLQEKEQKYAEIEEESRRLKAQMDEMIKGHEPKAYIDLDTKRKLYAIRFEFERDYYQRGPQLLQQVARQVVAIALSKLDDYRFVKRF